MKKISKEQSKRREDIVERGNAIKADLVNAWSAIAERIADYNETLGMLNEVIGEAIELRDEIVEGIEEYTGERSDKWQESDAASNYENWKDQWAGLDLDAIETIDADEPVLPDFDALLEPATEVES